MSVISDERGAVMVLMAVALFPMVALLAFVVDVSHWFDYSRNLQNRADAAALAGAQEFGACFGTSDQSVIGKWAQLYTGAGVNEPATQVPYTDAQVQAATGYKIGNYGYLNNTTAYNVNDPTSVDSPLTLKAGSLNSFRVVLNGSDYTSDSFTMAAPGTTATFCNSDPRYDLTDVGTPDPAGPMVDVKLSQQNLPLFFPLIAGRPTLHAHARATLEGEGSGPAVPIAVSDPGSTQCITAYFKRATDNSLVGTAVLHETSPTSLTWDNTVVQLDAGGNPIQYTGPTTLPMDANVYVQAFLHDCNNNGQIYDDTTSSGILYVNTYGSGTPNAGQPPRITTGGVTLSGSCAAGDQYFSVGGCTVQVTAHVAFSVPGSQAGVTAVNTGTGDTLTLHPDNTGTVWTANGNQGFAIGDQSGQNPIVIRWEQNNGSVTGYGNCTNGANNPCHDTFGVQAQAFGACNGCDQPDDSGPIIVARLSSSGLANTNAFQRNQPASVVLSLQLAGIRSATGASPTTILRFPTSGNHQTGLVDCTPNGTGSGTTAATYLIYGGCGPNNPYINAATGNPLPPLNPLYVNTRNTCGTPSGPPWPATNHQDCVQTTPGSKRVAIVCAAVLRITGQPVTGNCSGNGAATCPANNWPAILTTPGQFKNDPRKLQLILTAPVDLAAADNSPQYWIQVRRLATFYVTGWDTGVQPSCAPPSGPNEAFPIKGKNTKSDGAIWGHWMNDVQPGIGTGTPCDLANPEPTTCVPVLTR